MKNFSLKLFNAVALIAGISACSDINTAGGISEETEGVTALLGKKFSGAVQKGPFVEGSSVVLKETSAEGNLEPTGREFETKVLNDDGDFKFGDLDLECQYAILTAEGHYTREVNGERSHCSLRLNAVSNLEKRNTANINLLTHFEYKRVLNLVKSGKTFAQAKRQAATEVLGAFGVRIEVPAAEDLNIYNSSDADRTLYHISIFVDTQDFTDPWNGEGDKWEYKMDPANINCSKLQAYVDKYADDFAEDGTLNDSLLAPLVGNAYITNSYFGNVMYEGETGAKGRDKYELMAERTQFYRLVLAQYFDFESCTENRWGETKRIDKPLEVYDDEEDENKLQSPNYFLCDGFDWHLTTKQHIDSLKMRIDHEIGSMTDPRDGHKYQTVIFEHNGKTYEWMAEDLRFVTLSDLPSNGKKSPFITDGIYSWTNAMQIDVKYLWEPVEEGLIDSVHQGICPDGWHIASTNDWKNLINYVGNAGNLLDETWRTDKETAMAKDMTGVFFNKFDFNLKPMEKKYLNVTYNTYSHNTFTRDKEMELDSLLHHYTAVGDTEGVEWAKANLNSLRDFQELQSSFKISVSSGRGIGGPSGRQQRARVRCVKN
ncbi:FISUMP domain-containing protein [Fibrobacter sp. UWB12]|uniref:FISUMP domain-containing protein n=1 Tax=Fibrobacter sp. UWB12 TaxID=1896203 RepID=UPI000915A7BB|nr:FISUMP domain-containing protein [Fibrobacter sp. UWB12]SHK23147.1 major paralogous domain-containing protein [Fibrobacter sp. UWB12]